MNTEMPGGHHDNSDDRWARMYARKVDDYDEIGMGVMERIADGGTLADVLAFVAEHFESRDHIDELSQALYERARVTAEESLAHVEQLRQQTCPHVEAGELMTIEHLKSTIQRISQWAESENQRSWNYADAQEDVLSILAQEG